MSRPGVRLCSAVLACFLTVSLGLLACKPTVERESRSWSSNLESAAEFETRWPGFAPVISASKAEAEKLMKAADEISNQEARAEAMQAANTVLTPLLGKLRSVSDKLDKLDAAARRLDRLRVGPKQKREIADVKKAALLVHDEVAETLHSAAPANEPEALRLLDEQIGRLEGSIKACEELFERLSRPEPPSTSKSAN